MPEPKYRCEKVIRLMLYNDYTGSKGEEVTCYKRDRQGRKDAAADIQQYRFAAHLGDRYGLKNGIDRIYPLEEETNE
jgi:hypothetical protein